MIHQKLQKIYHAVHDHITHYDHHRLTKQSILDYLKEVEDISSNVECHQKLHIEMIVEINNYLYHMLYLLSYTGFAERL